MIKKIKSILEENRSLHNQNSLMLQELNWANVYHDSIRGEAWINETSLNIGRWAGGYAFFYVLVRILKDTKPQRILELGLGESTKMISQFIEHSSPETTHLIIEHDENWKMKFLDIFELSNKSRIELCPLVDQNIHGYNNKMYQNFRTIAQGEFDFILVDGPFGSSHFSRYELIIMLNELNLEKDFIILFDDTHRTGEQETLEELHQLLKGKNIAYTHSTYQGIKACTLICSERMKFLTTL
jgi:hypothetical protein